MKELTNTDRLVLLGRAIHGERWKRPLARDLGIDKRQVQRWAIGASEATDQIETQALAATRTHRSKLHSSRGFQRATAGCLALAIVAQQWAPAAEVSG